MSIPMRSIERSMTVSGMKFGPSFEIRSENSITSHRTPTKSPPRSTTKRTEEFDIGASDLRRNIACRPMRTKLPARNPPKICINLSSHPYDQ